MTREDKIISWIEKHKSPFTANQAAAGIGIFWPNGDPYGDSVGDVLRKLIRKGIIKKKTIGTKNSNAEIIYEVI